MSASSSLYHMLRDLVPGAEHSNPEISPSRTAMNRTFVIGDDNQAVPAVRGRDSPNTIFQALEDKLSECKTTVRRRKPLKDANGKTVLKQIRNKKGKIQSVAVLSDETEEVESKIREDASIMMEAILQLDPTFTGTCEELLAPGAEEKLDEVLGVLDVMIEKFREQTGPENTLAYSIHFDETSPHVHFCWCPRKMDKNGDFRLVGAKCMGTSKNAYRDRHDEMRLALKNVGYDATMVRVSDGVPKSVDQFKRLEDVGAQLDQREKDVAVREKSVRTRAKSISDREKSLETRSAEVDDLRRRLDDKEADLNRREAAVGARETAVGLREDDVARREDQLTHDEKDLRRRRKKLNREFSTKVVDLDAELTRRIDELEDEYEQKLTDSLGKNELGKELMAVLKETPLKKNEPSGRSFHDFFVAKAKKRLKRPEPKRETLADRYLTGLADATGRRDGRQFE